MKKDFKDEMIIKLVEQTFSKLSCPANGIGMYTEIKNAIIEAYKLGKEKTDEKFAFKTLETSQLYYSN